MDNYGEEGGHRPRFLRRIHSRRRKVVTKVYILKMNLDLGSLFEGKSIEFIREVKRKEVRLIRIEELI